MTTATLALTHVQRRLISERAQDLMSRASVAGLFLALAWTLGSDFMVTRRPTDLLLVVGEALVVILTCLRRRARSVDCRPMVRFITTVSMISPLLIRPGSSDPLLSEVAASTIAAFGLTIVILGKMSLGTSFGLLPANRGVKVHGLYRLVRHPIYLGYLVTHIPFLAAHPSAWNLVVIFTADAALIVRMMYEEETLSRDPKYRDYLTTVRWRLVPGVC